MKKVTRGEVDLVKNLIQVHTADAAGKVVTKRALKQGNFLTWCAYLHGDRLLPLGSTRPSGSWTRPFKFPISHAPDGAKNRFGIHQVL